MVHGGDEVVDAVLEGLHLLDEVLDLLAFLLDDAFLLAGHFLFGVLEVGVEELGDLSFGDEDVLSLEVFEGGSLVVFFLLVVVLDLVDHL